MASIKSTVCAAALVASFVTAQGYTFTEAYPNAKPLELNVYTAGDKEFYVTATLIHGGTEGVLIDTQFHADAVEKLVNEVAATKLTLKAIFITHPDGDHYGGMTAFRSHFPDTPIYMTARAVEEFKRTVDASKHLPTPEILPSAQLSVEGQIVELVADLQGDYAPAPANTLVWVPSSR